MALSLDYMGKFVIVMVTIAIGVSVIMTFGNQIKDSSPDIPESDEEGTSLVRAESQQKLVELLNYCHEKSLEKGTRSFTCFLVIYEDDDLNTDLEDFKQTTSFDSEDLKVDEDITSTNDKNIIIEDGDSLVVRYSVEEKSVILELGASNE